MNSTEIAMQGVGWLGMLMILYGMRQNKRAKRQALMASGAAFLAFMAGYPELKPVFFFLQAAVCLVGFINVKEGTTRYTLPLIFVGALVSGTFAIKSGLGPDTWLAILGLTGIALGYAGTPEREGGNQSLCFGLGGTGMVGYSLFGVLAGVWQAWPFLILNIPFGVMGFWDSLKERRRKET